VTQQLFSLAYFSRNEIEGTADEVRAEIAAVLESSRKNNAMRGVTGALIFSDGCFAQALEGSLEDIEHIFESIQNDTRHSNVIILHLHPIQKRSFGEWSMAFGGIDGISQEPDVHAEGMASIDEILTMQEGQILLAALHSVVRRDDVARRDELLIN
jgi:hypothetical protein